MDCYSFLRHSLDSALNNAHDMGIHDLERCIDHAIASVAYDILSFDPDGYVDSGCFEHYDDDDNLILFTRRQLLEDLPAALPNFVHDTYGETRSIR
tara:strand:- start:99 stop:386 length:288 start_codon:yes stop_codon:yes gene_type:complete